MLKRFCPSVALFAIVTLWGCTSPAQVAVRRDGQTVAISYTKSPYADYLFYLLYRSTGSFTDLSSAVPLKDISPLQDGSFLPDEVAASTVTNYAQLYDRASTYDAHVLLTEMLKKGEPQFPAFLNYWQKFIAPKEDQTIRAWTNQGAQWDPVEHLEQTERIGFPFSQIKIAMLALDPQGSSMQGPPTIFTTIRVPSLAWAIGHEGTHMILGPKGANWTKRENANEAIRLMMKSGGGEYDIEEAACLLMQAKLSIADHTTPTNYLSSSDFTSESPRRTLLLALERDWPRYQESKSANFADFLIAETIKTFDRH
jgi:hypothetical protein